MGYDEAQTHTQESEGGENITSGKTQRFVLLEMTPCDGQINVGQINVRQIGNKLVCLPRPGQG